MSTLFRRTPTLVAALGLVAMLAAGPACQKSKTAGKDKQADTSGKTVDIPEKPKPTRKAIPQVDPPMPVAAPPADATRTTSGIAYKILQAQAAGDRPSRNDTVTVNYTGWRLNGETYFSTRSRGKPQPMSLATTADGWTESMQLMKVGERAIFWIPPNLAFKGKPKVPETLVYEVELVSIDKAPTIPEDVAAAPANATTTKSGLAYRVLTKGTGKEKPRAWDNAMISYSAWDASGRMFDSTVARKRPRPALVYKEMPGLAEGLQTMVVGEVKRFWIPESLAKHGPSFPTGPLVYDVELTEVKKNPEPPPAPKDVAAAPADAKKTDKGVFYKVLKAGTGSEHPKPTDTVVVEYTGWTTDGKMFDSSIVKGQPARYPLNGVMLGWTDGLGTMVVGETTRLWIPETLAYKGAPGRPQGMLVFDITLEEIAAGKSPQMSPHGGHTAPGMEADPHAGVNMGGAPGTGAPPARPLPRGATPPPPEPMTTPGPGAATPQ